MRINLTSSNPETVEFLYKYLKNDLEGKEVSCFINGIEIKKDVITALELESVTDNFHKIIVSFESETHEIPIKADKTITRFIRNQLFVLETERHLTRIEKE